MFSITNKRTFIIIKKTNPTKTVYVSGARSIDIATLKSMRLHSARVLRTGNIMCREAGTGRVLNTLERMYANQYKPWHDIRRYLLA